MISIPEYTLNIDSANGLNPKELRHLLDPHLLLGRRPHVIVDAKTWQILLDAMWYPPSEPILTEIFFSGLRVTKKEG